MEENCKEHHYHNTRQVIIKHSDTRVISITGLTIKVVLKYWQQKRQPHYPPRH